MIEPDKQIWRFYLMTITMNKKLTQDQYFQSSDLALVACLSLSFPIESIDRSNPRKAVFCFKKSQELNERVQAYWRGETKVETRAYFDELRRIKARLYAGR